MDHYNADNYNSMNVATDQRAALTVILPTYNRAAFLPGAFESIKCQSFTDWDIVVVDDGSTDNTREIVQSFAAAFEGRLRYVYRSNGGAYAA